MMAGEKPGGHGERCVAVGTLDMAIWDAAAKIADRARFSPTDLNARAPARVCMRVAATAIRMTISRVCRTKCAALPISATRTRRSRSAARISIRPQTSRSGRHAIGGQFAPRGRRDEHVRRDDRSCRDDAARAVRSLVVRGHLRSARPAALGGHRHALRTADRGRRGAVLARGSEAARPLRRLAPERDVLVFDPAWLRAAGLSADRRALRIARLAARCVLAAWRPPVLAARRRGAQLGGAEVSPFAFHPFSGLADGASVDAGYARVPQAPGIGFELHAGAHDVLRTLSGR